MSELKKCPCVSNILEYDCQFPDCVGGWESAFKIAHQEITTLRAELDELKLKSVDVALEASRAVLRLTEELDEACDRHYRNGFNAGWNAGVDGNEKLLKSVNENRTRRKGE